jgi:glycosyltransferase involved in cell wall biosynthesis
MLLLEGTYPYVRGGVSGWVHQLIQGLPDISFGLVFLGATRGHYGEAQYSLPDNVSFKACYYIMEPWVWGRAKPRQGNPRHFLDNERLHEFFRNPDSEIHPDIFRQVSLALVQKGGLSAEDFYYSRLSWDRICGAYQQSSGQCSFVDYFWTVRNMHGTIFKLAKIARKLPRARVFHSISTGYAGLLGTLMHNLTGRPLILTEHGIYTKERKIDLQASYIASETNVFANVSETGMSYPHSLWIRFFEGLSRLIYASADPIISLYERNRARQVADGADRARTRVIPNGIDPDRFLPVRAARRDPIPLVLGLVGRIVPIKDVKTFIRAMRSVCTRLPTAEGWLVGPEEEDPDYVRECKDLVTSLGLEGRVKFLGFQNIEAILPQLGLMVLTSISEAFPLVLLEAYASGVPVLTTDVGACRELIEGKDPEDRALGVAGAVVPMADPEAVAAHAVALLTDEERWRSAQAAGIRRVERYYRQSTVIARYRELYLTGMAA